MTNKEKETMELLRKDNMEMERTITSLKRQIGGYKTSQENYRKQVEHYKMLCREGDELYELELQKNEELKKELDNALSYPSESNRLVKMANKVEELKQALLSKETFIESLQEKVQELRLEKSELEGKVESQKSIIAEQDEEIAKANTPWWRRLF